MYRKTKKLFAVCLVVSMLLTMTVFSSVASAATGLKGSDRYQTALAVVKAGWTESENIVIARGDDLADALAAAPLAYAKGKAPILLTETSALPTGVMEELEALKVKNVYIVGGTGAVSAEVEAALAAKFTVKRLFGADRAATSLAVAKEAFTTAPAKAVLVNGYATADALSISSIAAYNGMPILLANSADEVSADVAAYLTGKTVYAVGGTGVLSAAVVGSATRLYGADRYATNVAVLKEFELDYSKVFVAIGEDANNVDALGGAAFAALGNNPIVLVENALTDAAKTLLAEKIKGDVSVYTLGGLVPASVAAAVEALAPATLRVESVSAAKVDTLVVKFNKAVDTADVTLAVTKGTAAVEIAAPVWNASKTEATIKTTAKMTNGTYTVTAKSAADKDFSASGKTEVVSQYVKEIKLLNDVALTNDDSTKAYVYYDVLDQYGESLRTSTSIEWSYSAQEVNVNRTKGVITLKKTNDTQFNYSEKIYVTGVYAKTGVTVTGTVSVGAKQALNSIDIAGFVKKGTSEIVSALPSGFKEGTYYMAFLVKDQNGNPMADNNTLTNSDVTFISDNVLVVKELALASDKLAIDGTEYNAALVTPGMNVATGGEVNITAIANKTGNKTVKNIVVGTDQILTSFTMNAPATMIADGESVVVPFEAKDQNGEAIKNFVTLAKQAAFNKLTFTTSAGTLKLYEKADGTAELKYYDNDPAIGWDKGTDGIDRTISLTSVVVGGSTSSQLLYIQDMARPDAISAVDMDNVLVEQGSTTVDLTDFTFLDQYGRKMDEEDEIVDVANGFFKASKDSLLTGTDYAGYEFAVRATFSGDKDFLSDAGDVKGKLETSDLTHSVREISTDTATDTFVLTADADTVLNSKAGFSVKYEIVKYRTSESITGDHVQAVSTAKNEPVTVVDIKSVKGYTIGDLNKFFVETGKSNDITGDVGTTSLTISNINANLVAANLNGGSEDSAVATAYEQKVKVTGTYNGETVTIPVAYYTVEAAKLADANNDGKIDSAKLNDVKNPLRWSDLYDATSARYVRKDAEDTVKVTINDLDLGGGVVDTATKPVTISDAASKVTSITDGADEITKGATNTGIASPVYNFDSDNEPADGVITAYGKEFKVKDQYGVVVNNAVVSYKIASIVANAAGYAENNFIVTGNNSDNAVISGAERGDTFVLTIKADNVTRDVKVTVGADTNAYINNKLGNVYLDTLVGTYLEQQRIDGLN